MKRQLIFATALWAISLTATIAQVSQERPKINVSGSAEIKVTPDEIMLNVAVETRNEALEPARVENDRKIAASLAFLKQSGIPDKDVKTDFITILPDYDYNGSHVTPSAYIVRKNIEVRLTNVANFQNILTGLLTNGVNCVNDVNFRTTQLRKYRDQARAMAIHAAKEKAEALTTELDVKLGKVINIDSNDGGGNYRNYWGVNRGFNGSNASQSIEPVGGASDAADDTFAIGQISVSATVSVSFLIE